MSFEQCEGYCTFDICKGNKTMELKQHFMFSLLCASTCKMYLFQWHQIKDNDNSTISVVHRMSFILIMSEL